MLAGKINDLNSDRRSLLLYQSRQSIKRDSANKRESLVSSSLIKDETPKYSMTSSSIMSYLQNERHPIDLNLSMSHMSGSNLRGESSILSHISNQISTQSDPNQQKKSTWLIHISLFFLYYLVGVCAYQYYEGWSFTNAVYFVTQTYTTVGYGDLTPKQKSARLFTTFFIYIGILLVFSLLTEGAVELILYLRSKYRNPKKLTKLQVFFRHFLNLIMWIIILLLIPVLASIVYSYNENWPFYESFYFAVVSSTSVGYVDRSLKKNSSIWFNCFYLMISITLTMIALNKISSFKRHLEEAELWQVLEEVDFSQSLLDAIQDRPNASSASRAEYILHMLQLEGKLDYEQDIKRWSTKFKQFDIDQDGMISQTDLIAYQRIPKKEEVRELEQQNRQDSFTGILYYFHHGASFVVSFLTEAKDVVKETLFLSDTDHSDIK